MREGPGGSGGIVVLGGGYGGLRAALTLSQMAASRAGHAVTLVDQGADHQLITELHRVATGHLAPAAVTLPLVTLLDGTGVRFRQARVVGLDTAARRILLAGGERLPYAYLILALGSEAADHGVEGVRDYALGLRTLDDARRLWQHLQAVLRTPQRGPSGQVEPETVVVVGAGWTGTELAGQLVSLAGALARQTAGRRSLRVIVLEATDSIMPGFAPALARAARRFFEGHGVELHLRSMVTSIRPGAVVLEDGRAFTARTIVWTAGMRAARALAGEALPLGPAGQVRVDRYLRVSDQPNLYAVGDCALPPAEADVYVPGPSAQLALHQARVAAANLAADLTGRPPLAYRPAVLGEALSLGEADGAVALGPLTLSGRRALALKRAITLYYVRSLGGAALAAPLLGPLAAGSKPRLEG